jgi:phage shock protein A
MFGKTDIDPSATDQERENRDVLRKISKLLQKAKSTSHEPEAEAFRSKAEEMMRKHSISRGELSQSDFVSRRFDSRYKATPGWQKQIIFKAARFIGCHALHVQTGTGNQNAWKIFGHRKDVPLVRYMVGTIEAQMEALVETWKEGRRDTSRSATNAYRAGLAKGVTKRLWFMARQVSGGDSEEALVPVEERKSKIEKAKRLHDGSADRSFGGPSSSDAAATQQGYQDSDKIKVRKAAPDSSGDETAALPE